MAVKTSQSGARILVALERIAERQPLGVSELARSLDSSVAAAQRAIATLAEQGWIRQAVGKPVRWELTGHIHTVAQHAYGSHDLRRRARGALEELWRETGESVLLIVPDDRRFIIADEPFSIENQQLTPSLKIRRHILKEVYGERLDALYRG